MAADDYMELIIRSSDEAVSSSLRIPLDSTPEQRESMVKLWISAIYEAIQIPVAGEAKKVDALKAGGRDEVSDRSTNAHHATRRRRPGHG